MKNILKFFYVAAGFVALALGIAGIILPLLPTTPLLLLAAFCFVKGSKRFDHWFKNTSIYKKHLEPFAKEKAMTLKQKLSILLFADLMIITAFTFTDSLAVKVFLVIVVLYKYYYFIYKIKTVKSSVKTTRSSE